MTPEQILIGLALLLLAGHTALAAANRKRSGSAPPGRAPAPSVPFEPLFDSFASRTGVPARLMKAIVSVESSFNPLAVNSELAADKRLGRNVDSIGLGQILFPDTARSLRPGIGRDELLDPSTNLSLAFDLMAGLLRTWPTLDADGFPARSVAAYNAGAPRYQSDGTLKNQSYVDKVKGRWRTYA